MKPLTLLDQKHNLLRDKLEADARMQQIALELDQASAAYNETGRGMARERYFKLRSELNVLKSKSQLLQMEIGKLNAQLRRGDNRTLGELFIDAARVQLSTADFDRVMRLALDMRSGEI
jgi:hypothetical protein